MLTKDLLRVSRAGGGYYPQFASDADEDLAARVLGVFQGHVGDTRGELQAALTDLETDATDFKLVRGFAALLERDARFAVDATIDPQRARRAAYEAGESVGVTGPDADGRSEALRQAAETLRTDPETVEAALFADRDVREVLAEFDPRWTPGELVAQYNLSLAQTALFDATELRVRSSDPRSLISAVKRLGLLYEIRKLDDGGREAVLTGPDALFRRTRRYGTRFARLLRSIARADEWRLEATIDDRGTDRTLTLTQDDPIAVPDADPVADVSYDSDVERDFATRFSGLGLDWRLVREPELLDAGETVMVPDFAFEYEHAPFRVFFEIMGFWTPAYVEKKLAQLDAVDDELVVAVDESLGVGEDVTVRDHRAIPYSGTVRVKDVVDVLREYERDLVAASTAALPDELVPDADVVTISALASQYGVSEAAIEDVPVPEHERVGRGFVRKSVLRRVDDVLEPGSSLQAAENLLDEAGLADVSASAVFDRLGYRVAWTGLGEGTLQKK